MFFLTVFGPMHLPCIIMPYFWKFLIVWVLAVDRCLRSVDCRAALPCSEPTRVTPWADPSCATGRPAPLAVDRRALSAWPPCAVSRPSPPWVDPSDPFGRPALGHRSTGTGDRRPISGFYYSRRLLSRHAWTCA